MNDKLHDRIALVTGGSSGIGLATARELIAQGARVYVTGRRQSELDAALAQLGPRASGIRADAASLQDSSEVYARIRAEQGRLDILHINAGFYEFGLLDEVTEGHFDRNFDTNVKGPLFAVRMALPLMGKGGSIILAGSIVANRAAPNFSVYAATKAAIRSLARSWAVELKDRGIRVNVVSPGPINTPDWMDWQAVSIKQASSRVTWSPRFRWDAWAGRRRWPRRWHFWPPATPVSSLVSSCRSMAGQASCDPLSEHAMSNRLRDRVALVTGGSAGIGLASAHAFIEEGAKVYITGRRQIELDAAVSTLGVQAGAIRADMTRREDIEAVYERIASEQGRLDILFANAGLYEFARLGEITEEHIDRILDINIKGLVLAVQRALPLMRAGGSIVLTGSVAAGRGSSSLSVYAASKAAVRSFARSWANELKDRGIRVNVISPGPIDTPGLVGLAGGSEGLAALKRNFEASVPMGRLGRVDEVAHAAVFLASDDASFVTGSDLGVDGGKGQI